MAALSEPTDALSADVPPELPARRDKRFRLECDPGRRSVAARRRLPTGIRCDDSGCVKCMLSRYNGTSEAEFLLLHAPKPTAIAPLAAVSAFRERERVRDAAARRKARAAMTDEDKAASRAATRALNTAARRAARERMSEGDAARVRAADADAHAARRATRSLEDVEAHNAKRRARHKLLTHAEKYSKRMYALEARNYRMAMAKAMAKERATATATAAATR